MYKKNKDGRCYLSFSIYDISHVIAILFSLTFLTLLVLKRKYVSALASLYVTCRTCTRPLTYSHSIHYVLFALNMPAYGGGGLCLLLNPIHERKIVRLIKFWLILVSYNLQLHKAWIEFLSVILTRRWQVLLWSFRCTLMKLNYPCRAGTGYQL